MSINKWREVRYTDDGCSVFQCLSCYSQWESRSIPEDWVYCPYCGIQWIGQEKCRKHGENKWEWELFEKPYHDGTAISEAYYEYQSKRDSIRRDAWDQQLCWIIEANEGRPTSRWYGFRGYELKSLDRRTESSAAAVLKIVNKERQEAEEEAKENAERWSKLVEQTPDPDDWPAASPAPQFRVTLKTRKQAQPQLSYISMEV